MVNLENEQLRIRINPKGAELSELYHKGYKLHYLWNADPAFWAKYSPVLFPVVGTLKNNRYRYADKDYHLGRHGFARDMVFETETGQKDSVTFLLKSNEDTLKVYPFIFELRLRYKLLEQGVSLTYEVYNAGDSGMLFSIGGHPAFSLPLEPGLVYEDYFLDFNQKETTGRWPISNDGLIEELPQPLMDNTHILPLSKELFKKDALVLKHIQSDRVVLSSSKGNHGIRVTFEGFPYLGLWAAPGADFLCIEPWCGIADSVNSSGDFSEKEGVVSLAAGQYWQRKWVVSVF